MGYSEKQKTLILQKVLPPSNRSVSEISKEFGLSPQTIYNWLNTLKNDTLPLDVLEPNIPRRKSNLEKFTLLMESKSVNESEYGEWLRKNGLHSEHIILYERELAKTMSNKAVNIEDLQKQNKELLIELAKSKKEKKQIEKALTEMSALYALKKKAAEIWGEVEDD